MTVPFLQLAAAIPDKTGEIEVSEKVIEATILERVDNMLDGFLKLLPNFAIGIAVFFLILFIGKGVKKLVDRSLGESKKNLATVFKRILSVIILLVALLVATAIIAPSIKPDELLATLGVGGVAIGFAFKDILQNFLAGILLLVRQPFQVGDQIIVDGKEGTVESVETRSTIIKTYDGRQIIIPNGQVYMSAVTVNTSYETRRSQYDVGIGCNDKMAEARDLMLNTLKAIDGVVADPAPDVIAVDLADSANILRCRWWTKPEQASVMKIQSEVIISIEAALTENAIDMPYPTSVMLFHDQTEENDGVRSKQREGWPSDGHDPKTRRISDSINDKKNEPSETKSESSTV
jgi:small conductance mechanosensitive channel